MTGNETYLQLPTEISNTSYLVRTDFGGQLNFSVPALSYQIVNCSSELVRLTYGPCPDYQTYVQ